MTDIYPKEEWNYVYGLASLFDKVGVFSFARYDPDFWKDESQHRLFEDKPWDRILSRACKVMSHEIGHMFSLKHCTFY